MKNLVAVLIVVCLLALAVVAIDAANPTAAERAARDARAAARAQTAAAWAEQADERAEAVSVALWGLVAVTLAACAGVGAAVVRLAVVRSGTLHAHRDHALYPAVLHHGQWQTMNEPGAQQIAALPQRPSAPLARVLLGGMTATGRGAPAVIDATAVDVKPYAPRFDLLRSPHYLFAGQTGRGKTTAMWQVCDALARSHDIAWTVAEPGGANWKELATATDIAGIVDAVASVHAEMMHRLDVLHASPANHVAELPEPMPFVGFVVEEAESVYSDLKLANRTQAQQMAVQLRQLAAMGRKAGIVMLFGTQTALRVVFDGSVLENISNVFLFGGAQNLAERFRVSHDVRLPDLAPGQAYCPRDNRIVQFARVQRPTLRLALPAHADTRPATWGATEADTAPVAGATGMFWGAVAPSEVAPALPTDPAAPVSDAQRLHVLQVFRQSGGSLRATQRALFPGQQSGGHWFYWIRSIVQAEQ